MQEFLTSNSAKYRLLRTIVQGVIGVIIANLDLLVGYVIFDAQMRAFIVAIVMAILSPIMSELGASIETNDRISTDQFTFNCDHYMEMMGEYDGKENDSAEK